MIHATICGALIADAEYHSARRRNSSHEYQPEADFTIVTHRGGYDQRIDCRIRGHRATAVEPHLVAGKRVVVSGELRLPRGNGAARLLVDLCELAGGARTRRGESQEGEGDDAL